ncbi:helix-turn-helix transcriptional regulator [Streptomyces sp. NPDC001380]|uniref:helix-turn-helix transcriptional regulator n=1 Tax=Streptomyces sp. NPDC001380 TaxID=3364566 RepID=UPI00367C5327
MRITSSRIVGRDAELVLLNDLLIDLRQRSGGAVFLLGEAGIGKTRLANECENRARSLGVPVLRGRGSPSGSGTPLRPLIEALSSRFRISGPPADPGLGPYRQALSRLIPEWRTAAATVHREGVVELAEALLRLLAVLGRDEGCVLVLEDLHDMDSETITVLEYLVDNVAGLPVLLLATLRPQPGPAFDLADLADRRRAASVAALRPLQAEAVAALAAGCLGVPAAAVPAAAVERLVSSSDGNPYLVEELLAEMVGSGLLRRSATGWQVVGDLSSTVVPASVVRGYGRRIELLDSRARETVLLAASLGARFSVATLRLIAQSDEQSLFAQLRSAIEAGLVLPDRATPDRYTFRHALTAEAVLAAIPPAERAAIARHAAVALQRADPELSDDRCQLAAGLWVAAGDPAEAALLYAEAGRRAQADGLSGTAVVLLQRAHDLADPATRAGITESLLYALAEAGQLDRALALVDSLTPVGTAALDVDSRIAVHTRLAWVAVTAERPTAAAGQVAAARALLVEGGTPEQNAALSVVEGHLSLLPGQDGSTADAERTAREAAEVAERAALPVLACQAWQLLALLVRERGFDTADACLERMLAVAETHALPLWRVEALTRLGANAYMRTGDSRRLEQAREAADELGAIMLAQDIEGALAMNAVLRGDPRTAREILGRCLDASARMHNLGTHRYLLLISATLAAHLGRRREMEQGLVKFRQAAGAESPLTPVMLGLCRAVCALLEENRDGAVGELAAAADWESSHPSMFYLAGRHGLSLLLEVLAGRAGRAEYSVVAAAPAAGLAWNRQFLLLAEAVLLGREGRAEDAAEAVALVRQTAGLFPTGHHLGLRLVSEAALADGWGDPTSWLQAAEEYFHQLDVPSVASACRALLRQAGVTVAQRRSGRDLIPAALRARGLTPREYEVLALLTERPSNQDIARQLCISPRTVEKHIASLLQKIALPDRAALSRLAADISAG